MIQILHDIFIAVLYICGSGLFSFVAVLFWAMVIRVIKESKDD